MNIPEKMKAYLLTGFGDIDKLSYREDVPVPSPEPGEVLLRVDACGVNNTDIWTRLGAYGGSVDDTAQSGWQGGGFSFPRIQGADIVGSVVALGRGAATDLMDARVIVNPTLYRGDEPTALDIAGFIGSDRDGGFAEFVAVPSSAAIPIDSPLSSAKLATFMVSYLTAEHMLNRAGVNTGDHVLITGASGGVGSALLQLAKRRKTRVSCIVGSGKEHFALGLGADTVHTRGQEALENNCFDVVADVVGGEQVPLLLDSLKAGGRFVTAGAIAGATSQVDWRSVYLKHLTLYGSSLGTPREAHDICTYIETEQIRPVLHSTFALKDLVKAQREFTKKRFLGKLVIIP